jgi:hypothetical protein
LSLSVAQELRGSLAHMQQQHPSPFDEVGHLSSLTSVFVQVFSPGCPLQGMQIAEQLVHREHQLLVQDVKAAVVASLFWDAPRLSGLQQLWLQNCELKHMDAMSAISSLQHLTELHLDGNKLEILPNCAELAQLETISLNMNRLRQIDSKLLPASLKRLLINDNELQEISNISNLHNLEVLLAPNNRIGSVDLSLAALKHLRRLDLSSNRLKQLPPVFQSLTQLEDLNVSQNQLGSLPSALGVLPLRHFTFHKNPLNMIPAEAQVDKTSLLGYLAQLYRSGEVEAYRTKLMIVGQENVSSIACYVNVMLTLRSTGWQDASDKSTDSK